MTGGLYSAAQQLMQNYDIDKIIQKEVKEDLQQKLARLIDIKVDSRASRQTRIATEKHGTTKSRMKKKAQPLKKLAKARKAAEAKPVKEVKEIEEREEPSFEQQLEELKETATRDEKYNRYENARFVMDLAGDPKTQPDDLLEYLIQPTGPYGKRPDEAAKCFDLAVKETDKQVKKLKAKHGPDHRDVAAAEKKLQTLSKASGKLMSHIDTELSSQYTGTSVGRAVIYKSKLRQDTLKQVPLFQNEEELKAALQELDKLTDPTAHYQWCSKYDYKQILAIYNEYSRQTSEILNSQAGNIEPGLLNNRIKVLQNNTSFKFVNRVFGNELIWGMKQWSRDIGSLETGVT